MPSQRNQEIVEKIKSLVQSYPIIAVVNMKDLPTPQLQRMRDKLRGEAEIYMAKKRLMKIAFDEVKDKVKGIEKLKDYLEGMPALLLAEQNPFKLYMLLNKNKSKAPAKAGQVAPNDIEIKAGPTQFAPGPIISELGSYGLQAGVEDGKVAIKEDAVVAKEGDEITEGLASLLQKMGMEPMEIGLDLQAAYEEGNVFTKDQLAVDENEYFNNFTTAHRWAFNLAMEAGIFNADTSEQLVQKSYREAKALALECGIMAKGVEDEVVGKAEAQAKSLSSEIENNNGG